MTDGELLNYIQRILQTCSENKARLTLTELRRILDQLNTPRQQILLVNRAFENLPEAQSAVRVAAGRALTERDLEIAAQRGEERRRRERAMEDQGRC